MSINWELIILALIAAIPPTLASIAALIAATRAGNKADTAVKEIKATREIVNGHMASLVELNRKDAASEATVIEKQAEAERQAEAAK